MSNLSFLVLMTLCHITNNNAHLKKGNLDRSCQNINEDRRKDCGFPGISPSQCISSGCCYVDSYKSGPWCFYPPDFIFRTTTQPANDVTSTAMTQSPRQKPAWLKTLIDFSTSLSKARKSNTVEEKPNKKKFSDLIAVEIQDELLCLQTKNVRTNDPKVSECSSDLAKRVACVEGKLPKEEGQSECSACKIRDCCYDPVTKRNNGKIVPYCFRSIPLTTTETTFNEPFISSSSTSSVTTSAIFPTNSTAVAKKPKRVWEDIDPAFQPGQILPSKLPASSANRLKKFFNAMSFPPPEYSHNPLLPSNYPNINPFSSPKPYFPFGGVNSFNPRPQLTSGHASGNFLPMQTITSQSNLLKGNSKLSELVASLLKPNSPTGAAQINKQSLTNAFSPLLLLSLLNQNRNNSQNPISTLKQILKTGKPGAFPIIENTGSSPNLPTSAQKLPASPDLLKLLLRPSGKPSKTDIIKYLLNRNRGKPVLPIPSKNKPITAINPLQNALKNLNSGQPLSSLLNNNGVFLTNKKASRPSIVLDLPSTSPPKDTSQTDDVGIPNLFEASNLPLPRSTCYPRNCGHRSTDGQVTQRIVGGQWSGGIEYWPWAASLRRTFTDDNRFVHICGATLISRQWILTAGHCFLAYKAKNQKISGQKEEFTSVYSVHVGKYPRDFPTVSTQVYGIDSFQAHPNFNYESLSYDIAVAKLTEPVQFTNYVQPACLPGKTESLLPNDKGWITGWGETLKIGSHNKSKLKELTLPLISSSQCKKSWPKHFHEAWICTEGAYLEDACAGDSGGPLVKRGADLRWDVIGIAVAGTRTCSTMKDDIKPGIYTKVGYFREFIDSATRGACEERK